MTLSIRRTGIWLLGIALGGGLFASSVSAVDFILRDQSGIYHFDCINACGPVRVRKSGRCEFFVQSPYYNGKVNACEAETAAMKACGELPFDQPRPKELLNPACTR
jgi:hypothetical protein